MPRIGSLLPPLAGLILAAIYYGTTFHLPLESRIFPQTVLAPVVGFGLVLLVRALRSREVPSASIVAAPGSRAPLIFILAVAFVVIFASLNFLIASSLFLLSSLLLLGIRWAVAVPITISVTAGYYVIFAKLLGMPL